MTRSLKNLMTKNIVVSRWTDSLQDAQSLMATHEIRHLPVVDDAGNIVGIISEKDLMRALQVQQPDFTSGYSPQATFDPLTKVRDFMSWPVESIDTSESIAEAARIMLDKKISSVLVTKDEAVIGIVTTEDLLRELILENEGLGEKVRHNVEGLIVNSPVGRIAQALADVGI